MMIRKKIPLILLLIVVISPIISIAQVPIVPSSAELNCAFGQQDIKAFRDPARVYHPETWFHFIGGNVSKAGITADLEAIANAGISGIQLFHGQFGGPWPGVNPQITCLSSTWDDAVKFTAEECRRLGLRFTMQNCPGWAMSGGPWISPENAMRSLVWSRIYTNGGQLTEKLPVPQPSSEDWRNYKDIAVLAFPAPVGDDGEMLKPSSAKSDKSIPWKEFISGENKDAITLEPSSAENPHWIEVSFPESAVVRTIEFSDVQKFNHAWCYEPGIDVKVLAIFPDGSTQQVLKTPMPAAVWQSDQAISLSCDEAIGANTYRIEITNKHDMSIHFLRLYSAARKNNWESEAAWTLRSIVRGSEHPKQSAEAYIQPEKIIDISAFMDKNGILKWNAPEGKWTILRVGHVNSGYKNGPAPAEGTGWECDKLSESGPQAQFAGYIGRLNNGALSGGLLKGMLMDSWECNSQTWTDKMEQEFKNHNNYELRKWLPALSGYVIQDQATTSRFLRDWRSIIDELLVDRFYGGMSKLAKANGLNITYETASGDVFPADIMSYFKHADVPMCEFWQPYGDSYVGSINFKPIKPTVSAARLYGKPRISAEAFTSFSLTWDEHLGMLKEVANQNFIEGVTHLVFHTYTHNPRTDGLPPGTSFGSGIGSPFLRGQTWWKYMPEFTTYLSRLNYLFERGKPVSDVLWYLGDEINHKPDQKAPFPKGFKYDYCNPDVLMNRLSVKNGKIVTPEGLSYRIMWIPDNERMLPETLEKILSLVRDGAIIVGDAPKYIATLKGGEKAQIRFDIAVKKLWGDREEKFRQIGKGKVFSGIALDDVLKQLNIPPDVTGEDGLWIHRQIDGADWYYVCAPFGKEFRGELSFNNTGNPEIWNPLNGEIEPASVINQIEGRTSIHFELAKAGSCFVVFRKSAKAISRNSDPSLKTTEVKTLTEPWSLNFPDGWGTPSRVIVSELKPWKELEGTSEAKSFSGTVSYTTTFDIIELEKNATYNLDLGQVEMIAEVTVNGKKLNTLWTSPYCLDITNELISGKNSLKVDVTSTWYNRLVFDANQPEEQRKTWTINGPSKDEQLRESGLLGPVKLSILKR